MSDLTNDAYCRWLRASKPDLGWFLDQPDDVQETLAMLGDDYMVEVLSGVVAAIHPKPSEDEAEEDHVRRLAHAALTGMMGGRTNGPRAAAQSPTLAGFGNRKPGNPKP